MPEKRPNVPEQMPDGSARSGLSQDAVGAIVRERAEVLAEVERLREALAELVRLKDGPRDDAYRAAKGAAWQAARDALDAR